MPDKYKQNKLHYVENSLSKYPSKERMIAIQKLNPLTKKGVFTEEEDNLIRKQWRMFQQVCIKSDFVVFYRFFIVILNGTP